MIKVFNNLVLLAVVIILGCATAGTEKVASEVKVDDEVPEKAAVAFKVMENPTVIDDSSKNPAEFAASGEWEKVRELVESGADINSGDESTLSTALSWAVANQNEEMVDFLLSKGAATDLVNKYGNNPLMIAVGKNSVTITEKLIKAGSDTEWANPQTGDTALLTAIKANNVAQVKKLLELGADPHGVNVSKGSFPLLVALMDSNINPDIAEAVINATGKEYSEMMKKTLSLFFNLQHQGVEKDEGKAGKEVLDIVRNFKGKGKQDVASVIYSLGRIYRAQGQYSKAEPLYLKSLKITKHAFGEDHPNYATALNNFAGLYEAQGQYSKAEPLYLKSLEIKKHAFGEGHPHYASSLNNLAGLYEAQGQYSKAEPLYIKVLEITKHALGENHPDYALALNNLGSLYMNQGQYSKAEPLLLKSLEIRKHAFGEDHPNYALALNNLGSLYMNQGQYSKAEPLLLKSLEIRKHAFGEGHPHYASSLNNLAGLYEAQGQYSKAESLCIKSLEIWKNALGENHPHYAQSLNNLALLYVHQGQYSKAEPLYLRSLEIVKHALGEDHPDYAMSLNNLAVLYKDQGQYSKAEPLYLKALEIVKHALGENHPNYAASLNNRAALYMNQGQYSEAEPLLLKSLEIWKNTLGENHPDYALVLNNAGGFYFSTSRPDSARPLMLEALPIVENHIQDTFAILTERQRMSFVKNNRYYFDWYLTLFDRKGDEKDAYNHSMKWKGVVLNSMKQQKAFLDERAAKDPEFRKKLDDYQDILHYQSMLLTKQGLKEGEKEELKRVTKEREEIERFFAREDASYRKEKELQKITVDNICSALKPDEAIVDYLKYTKRVLKKGEQKNDIDRIDSYLAFIVRGGKDCTNPVRIELGEAEEIEKRTDQYREQFKVENRDDPENVYKKQANRLWVKIWEPLEQHLGDRKKVWIIPDGALGGVSFQTLKTDKDEYLIDKYDIRYLDNSADLYRAVVIKRDSVRKTALFAGNIDFGEKEKTDDKCFPTDMEELYDETGAVRNLLKQNKIKTTVYEKDKATKPAVFDELKSSPGIVHISTHGFYLPDECVTKAPAKFGNKDNKIMMLDKKEKVEADPMSRSGIVFAGVNDPEQREYAIATGIDFSGLNLRNTDLFVLSACQSGMGGMTEGEGVVGMRRALSMAGVKTIVSTLWDAEDTMTKQIMQEFYEGYLKTGKPHETMRAIQKKYRAQYPDRYLLWGFLAVSGATE